MGIEVYSNDIIMIKQEQMKQEKPYACSLTQIDPALSSESVEHDNPFSNKQMKQKRKQDRCEPNKRRVQRQRSLIDQLYQITHSSLQEIVESSIQSTEGGRQQANPSIEFMLDEEYDAVSPQLASRHNEHIQKLKRMFKRSGQAISQSIASQVMPNSQLMHIAAQTPPEESLRQNRLHGNRPFLRKKHQPQAQSTAQNEQVQKQYRIYVTNDKEGGASMIKSDILRAEKQYLDLKHENDALSLIASELAYLLLQSNRQISVERTTDNEEGFMRFKQILEKELVCRSNSH